MKIAWLSANKFGYEVLKEVLESGISVSDLITLSEDSRTIMYDGIETNLWKELCEINKLDIHFIGRINEEKNLLRTINPDIVIMCGWRQIIDSEILNIPKIAFVGFHPTLLPIGRGPAPIINTILNDFKESGLTMFYVSEGLDDGDIIGQEKFFIDESDHANDVYEKIITAGKKLVKIYLPMLISGNAPRVKQDETKSTVFRKLTLKDNKINLKEESIEQIFRKIKALSKPYKGAYIEKDGKKLRIWRAQIE